MLKPVRLSGPMFEAGAIELDTIFRARRRTAAHPRCQCALIPVTEEDEAT